MKNSIILLAFIVPLFMYAQMGPDIKWQRALGGFSNDYAFLISPTPDGGFILGGNALSKDGDVVRPNGGNDFWVIKFDAQKKIQWQRALGSIGTDKGTLVKPTADGGYIVAGNVISGSGSVARGTYKGGESDIWVVKLSATGNTLWQKTLGGSYKDEVAAIEEVPGGGFIIGGNTTSTNGDVRGNHGLQDIWVCKISATGTLLWQRAIGGSGDDELTDMLLAGNGNIIVGGVTTSTASGDIDVSYGSRDLWMGIINGNGQLTWKKTVGGSASDGRLALRLSADGSFIYFSVYGSSTDGEFSGGHGNSEIIVYKIGLSGDIAWKKFVGGSGEEGLYTMQATADGGCVVGGISSSSDGDFTGASGGFIMVAKLAATGNVEWAKRYGGSTSEELYNIGQTQDGGYVFYGSVQSNGGDITNYHPGIRGWEPDTWVVRLNNRGLIVWQRCYGGSGEDWVMTGGNSVFDGTTCNLQSITDNRIQFPDGSYYFLATTNSKDGDVQGIHFSTSGGTRGTPCDIWVVQLPADGLINQQTSAPLGIRPEDGISAYPNPFVYSTAIQFTAWESSKASVDLYDLAGRKLRTIWAGNVVAGQRIQAGMNGEDLPKGNFIFVITNGKRTETGRLIKLE